MNYLITPLEEYNDFVEVDLPLSKSISNRVVLISALAGVKSKDAMCQLAECDDTEAMLRIFDREKTQLDLGAAGTALRFATAYFAQDEGNEVVLTGTKRLCQRPIAPLVDALRQLGADISYVDTEGFAPLRVKGKKLSGGEIEIDASVSSQFISALMMIAPLMSEDLTIRLKGHVASAPYIAMTRRLMFHAGVETEFFGGNTIVVKKSAYRPDPFADYTVEPDWSAAAFLMEATALTMCDVRLKNLNLKSIQGDSLASKLFETLGVFSTQEDEGVTVSLSPEFFARPTFDFSETPDLVQPFVVTACLLDIPFRLVGISTLRDKETDRIAALRDELAKLTYDLNVDDDQISWNGERHPVDFDQPIIINTYKDHRMAMAFAPAAAFFPLIVISDAGVVTKSFPLYWDVLQKIGFQLTPVEINYNEEN